MSQWPIFLAQKYTVLVKVGTPINVGMTDMWFVKVCSGYFLHFQLPKRFLVKSYCCVRSFSRRICEKKFDVNDESRFLLFFWRKTNLNKSAFVCHLISPHNQVLIVAAINHPSRDKRYVRFQWEIAATVSSFKHQRILNTPNSALVYFWKVVS